MLGQSDPPSHNMGMGHRRLLRAERLTGEYIKQLQLKKQIEQRAKEAAKSREAAEEMLAKGEEALKLVKKMDAAGAEAEKLLTEASSFFKDKDYRSSLGLSTKSLETSRQGQKGKVGSILQASDELRTLVEKRGTKDEALTLRPRRPARTWQKDPWRMLSPSPGTCGTRWRGWSTATWPPRSARPRQ